MNQNEQVSPFTEIPEEIKKDRSSFGRMARGFFNFLFLLILGLALLALVLAFAYQQIFHPETLQLWASGLIATVQEFIQSLAPAPK